MRIIQVYLLSTIMVLTVQSASISPTEKGDTIKEKAAIEENLNNDKLPVVSKDEITATPKA